MIALALMMSLPWATLALYVVIGAVLLWKLVRTRETAFAWLGVAVLIWPLLSYLADRASAAAYFNSRYRHKASFFPYSLVDRGAISWGSLFSTISRLEQLIGVALLLIAVIHLCRMNQQPVLRQAA